MKEKFLTCITVTAMYNINCTCPSSVDKILDLSIKLADQLGKLSTKFVLANICEASFFGKMLHAKTQRMFQPFSKRRILDSSKLKEFTDDNFRFNTNNRKLSKWLEDTVRKGEIDCFQEFLLFPQCRLHS